MSPAAADPIESLLAGLAEREIETVDRFEVSATAARPSGARGGRRTTAAPPALPPGSVQVDVPLATNEHAVLLAERDGIVHWILPESTTAPPASGPRGARSTRGARRVAHFRLGQAISPPIKGARGARRLRLISDGVISEAIGKAVGAVARYVVLRFVAKAAAAGAKWLLERSVKEGPVIVGGTDPVAWAKPAARPETLSAVKAPTDRPLRVLLLVHGTFSSTIGTFAGLSATAAGRRLLASKRYDLVLGHDHRTLSVAPEDNAKAILGSLKSIRARPGLEIDAIAFSRGGLVLRSLVEELLPASRLRVDVRRCLFVGCTNAGTGLADPQQWRDLADLLTNLGLASSRVLGLFPQTAAAAPIVAAATSVVGELIVALTTTVLGPKDVPGLAAMDPEGAVVRRLNARAGLARATIRPHYGAIAADFDPRAAIKSADRPGALPKALLTALAGAITRARFGPNDLVVPTASMTTVRTGWPSSMHLLLAIGKGTPNGSVYHTVYFPQDDVAATLAAALLDQSPSP